MTTPTVLILFVSGVALTVGFITMCATIIEERADKRWRIANAEHTEEK